MKNTAIERGLKGVLLVIGFIAMGALGMFGQAPVHEILVAYIAGVVISAAL